MAYAERSARCTVSIDRFWADPADDRKAIAWDGLPGTSYLNLTGIAWEDHRCGVRSAFGRNPSA